MKSSLLNFGRRSALALVLAAGLLLALAAPVAAYPNAEDGAPVLVISQYATSPSPATSGQGFTLTITVTNTGSKYANNITASVGSGSTFVGVGAPASLGQLDPGMSATVSLQVQTASVAAGAYPLQVDLSFRIGESGEQITQRSVGIQVAGGSGVKGDPQVVIQSAQILSQPRAVGDSFEVQLVLRNAGERKAYGVSAALAQNEYLSPALGGGTSAVGDLAPGQSLSVTVSLVLAKISPTGRADLSYKLSYQDANNTDHSSTETASLELGAAGRQNPQLIVAGYKTEPQHPGPGDSFTLWLQVTNVGAGPARRVLARLGGDKGLDPFLPLATSNVGYAGEIAPGATAAFSTTLLMAASAAGGAYSLTVDLAYENTLAEALTESEIVGLL
ncbi:MAG: CARDB domain-containing protein, partial [Anaerolineales bacterium]